MLIVVSRTCKLFPNILSGYCYFLTFSLSHNCEIYLMDLTGDVLDFKAGKSKCRCGSGLCQSNNRLPVIVSFCIGAVDLKYKEI